MFFGEKNSWWDLWKTGYWKGFYGLWFLNLKKKKTQACSNRIDKLRQKVPDSIVGFVAIF